MDTIIVTFGKPGQEVQATHKVNRKLCRLSPEAFVEAHYGFQRVKFNASWKGGLSLEDLAKKERNEKHKKH